MVYEALLIFGEEKAARLHQDNYSTRKVTRLFLTDAYL